MKLLSRSWKPISTASVLAEWQAGLHPADLRALRAPPSEVDSNSLRFLHLDAVHDHPSVLNDLRNFVPLLTREAIVVLDDCFDPDWPGVPTAMTEFCLSDMGRHIRPFAASRSKMYLCARPYVEIYQRCIVASGHIDNMSLERVLDVSVYAATHTSRYRGKSCAV